jgi:hypothetical protein
MPGIATLAIYQAASGLGGLVASGHDAAVDVPDDASRWTLAARTDQVRDRIVAAATAEFSRYGIAGARIDRIAKAARTSKERVYAYFSSKEDLYRLVSAREPSGEPSSADAEPRAASPGVLRCRLTSYSAAVGHAGRWQEGPWHGGGQGFESPQLHKGAACGTRRRFSQ